MDGSIRLTMVLALVAAMGGSFWSPEPPPPLTPVQLAKIGSLFPTGARPYSMGPSLASALNLPPPQRTMMLSYVLNGLNHWFAPVSDGGLLLAVGGNTGTIFFHLDDHLRLVKSVLLRTSDKAILPVPDPVGGLRAEFAYWAPRGVNQAADRLPSPPPMTRAIRFLAVLVAFAALAGAARAESAPPLTPAQIVKIGSWLRSHGVRTKIPDPVRLPLALPAGPLLGLSLKELNNRAQHELDLLPDGGFLLVVSNQAGSSIFRVGVNLQLLGSLHMKNWISSPEPNPETGLEAEWAYWANIANHTPY